MAEPQIHYCKTSDEVSIAYWTLGEGMPLVHLSVAYSHAQMEWQIPECRQWYERLAQKRKLIRFDYRGWGSSDRNVTEFSIDAVVRDLEAVVDRLGLKQFALFGAQHFAPVAIAYSARHPERVSHLLLWCGWADGADWVRSPQVQGYRASLGTDWLFYTESSSQVVLGWSAGEPARRYAALARESVDSRFHWGTVVPAITEWDVTPLLAHVTSPTLVLHRRQWVLDIDVARGLASRIPDARLALLDGESGAPYLGDTEAAATAIDDFLSDVDVVPAEETMRSGMTAILFADIADSAALTEGLGDAAFREKARALDSALRAAIREHGGNVIEGKLLGDGILAIFPAASQAIVAALTLEAAAAPTGLGLHIGLHAGDVIRESDNVFGGAVNIAARISALAPPGEVFVSRTVADLARTSAGVTFEDRGEHALKGIADPQRVFAVRESEAG